jgi:hypothetical protein
LIRQSAPSAPAIAGEGDNPAKQGGGGGAGLNAPQESSSCPNMFARCFFFLRTKSAATKTKLRVRRPLHHGSLATRAPVVPSPAIAGAERGGALTTRSASELDARRSAIGEAHLQSSPSPFAFFFLHKGKREAERRQTRVTNRRILRCGSRPHEARSSVGVPPRLSPKGIIPSQRLSFRPGFLGRGLSGRYPPSPVPVQGCTSRPGHNVGGLIPKPPGSELQIHPRAPHPLHLSACLRKTSFERAG